MKILYSYTDGGCSGNWSTNYNDRRMVWVATDQFGDVLFDRQDNSGGSNNIAELLAIKDAIKYAIDNHYEVICITTDSMIAKGWIEAAWQMGKAKVGKHINNPELTISILREIVKMCELVSVFIRWKPREVNLAGHYIENKFQL